MDRNLDPYVQSKKRNFQNSESEHNRVGKEDDITMNIPKKSELYRKFEWVRRVDHYILDKTDPGNPIEFIDKITIVIENMKLFEPSYTAGYNVLTLKVGFLRRIIRIKPRTSFEIKSNFYINQAYRMLYDMAGPEIPEGEFLYELCRKEGGITFSMKRAISRFLAGTFFGTVGRKIFEKIKNHTDRKPGEQANRENDTILDGFEVTYSIVGGFYEL